MSPLFASLVIIVAALSPLQNTQEKKTDERRWHLLPRSLSSSWRKSAEGERWRRGRATYVSLRFCRLLHVLVYKVCGGGVGEGCGQGELNAAGHRPRLQVYSILYAAVLSNVDTSLLASFWLTISLFPVGAEHCHNAAASVLIFSKINSPAPSWQHPITKYVRAYSQRVIKFLFHKQPTAKRRP